MIKERTTVEIDAEVKLRLKHLNIQIGPACNNFLRNLANAYFTDKYAEELFNIDDELETIGTKISELSIRKTTLLEKKEAIMVKLEADKKKEDKRVDVELDAIKSSGILSEVGR